VRVGGGLSTAPHFGIRLNAFVRWAQVLPVIRGITEIFRDSDVLRRDRTKARLKFLFLEHGWTAERFQEELERRLGFRLDPAVEEEPPERVFRDHVGLHPQKQEGYYYAGFAILRGRITAEQMRHAAEMADRYGDGQLRTTNMQNLVVLNIPEARLGSFLRAVEKTDLRLEASSFWRGAIACTGTEFCKLAIAETKDFARWIVEEMERRLPGFDEPLRINVNGCPNSCGQHWIADIGLQGCKMKVGGEQVDAFDILLGGAVGRGARFTRRVGLKIPASEVPDALERLLREYLSRRRPGERFHEFCWRHSEAELRALLVGEEVEACAAPEGSGPPPHGIEG
jgi:sulfite reductase (ferredoxin)